MQIMLSNAQMARFLLLAKASWQHPRVKYEQAKNLRAFLTRARDSYESHLNGVFSSIEIPIAMLDGAIVVILDLPGAEIDVKPGDSEIIAQINQSIIDWYRAMRATHSLRKPPREAA